MTANTTAATAIPETARTPMLAEDLKRLRIVSAGIAACAAIACLVAWLINPQQFFFRYLVAVLFVTSLGLGSLFWLLLHYITFSSWSMVTRRLIEHAAGILVAAAVMFLPVLAGIHFLFPWSADVVDSLVAGKQGYLNTPFFIARAVAYFGVWMATLLFFRRGSLRQDEAATAAKSVQATSALRRWSAPAMLLLALTTTFASFDWIMSLDPHWYSNIFGVYFWAGSFSSSLAVITLLALWVRVRPGMSSVITIEHLHDLGKLQVGLVCFWAYIAFSQYLLIWYAAIPEETAWFAHRAVHGWGVASYVLGAGHFLIPFLVLLPRSNKRSPAVLAGVSLCVLVFHGFDLTWQVIPSLGADGYIFHWIDLLAWSLAIAVSVWTVLTAAVGHRLAPLSDPKLAPSMLLENE